MLNCLFPILNVVLLILHSSERLDPDTSGILSTLCDHSFQCPCTSKWTYLSCPVSWFLMPFYSFSQFLVSSEVNIHAWFILLFFQLI